MFSTFRTRRLLQSRWVSSIGTPSWWVSPINHLDQTPASRWVSSIRRGLASDRGLPAWNSTPRSGGSPQVGGCPRSEDRSEPRSGLPRSGCLPPIGGSPLGIRHAPGVCRGRGPSEVGHTGLEPVTSCVSYKRASQLRQWPKGSPCGAPDPSRRPRGWQGARSVRREQGPVDRECRLVPPRLASPRFIPPRLTSPIPPAHSIPPTPPAHLAPRCFGPSRPPGRWNGRPRLARPPVLVLTGPGHWLAWSSTATAAAGQGVTVTCTRSIPAVKPPPRRLVLIRTTIAPVPASTKLPGPAIPLKVWVWSAPFSL